MNKILEKFLFVQVLFLFAFIPLYPKFPLLNITGTFVAIRIEDLLIAAAVGIWAIYLTTSGKLKLFLADKLNLALLLFFFIGAVSLFSANFVTQSVISHISFLHYLRRMEFMMLMPVVATVIKTKKQLIISLVVLTFVVVVVNMYALGQQYLDWPVISTTNSEFSKGLILSLTPGARVNSTFAGHYDLGVFLAMTIVILSAFFFAVRKSLKIFVVGLGALSLLVLIMTAARLSFVAAILGILSVLIIANKKRLILFMCICLFIIMVYPSQLRDRLLSTFTVNVLGQGLRYQGETDDQKIRNRLNIPTLAIKTSSDSAVTSTIGSPSAETASDITPGEPVDTTQLGVYRSFSIRLNLEWPRAITAFYKNPFLGTGYSSLGIATDNDILRSLGEVGFLGTFAFILVLIEIYKRLWMGTKSQDRFLKYLSIGSISLMIAFIINSLFIDVFEASKVATLFWMILGLNLAMNKNEDIKKIL